MDKDTRTLSVFLFGTFGLSFIAFLLMLVIPNAHTPESATGFPVWVLAVWSPSITAIILAIKQGAMRALLAKVINIKLIGLPLLMTLIPITILTIQLLYTENTINWQALPISLFVLLIGFNLFLGPLGEELGWRGLMQPLLAKRYGWLGAALLTGIAWAIWHGPLWFIDSPQSQIPFLVFCGHVMSYSLLMGAAWQLAPHSLLPSITLHLMFNVTAGVALILGVATTMEWYTDTLKFYAAGTILVVTVTMLKSKFREVA